MDRRRHQAVREVQGSGDQPTVPADLLALDARVTDCNSAFFDVANDFHGCIAGCHEVLRRQGLLKGIWCLDPEEGLGPGQMQQIDRVYKEHADLSDGRFRHRPLTKMAGMTTPEPLISEPFVSLRNVRKVYRSAGSEFLAVPTSPWTCKEGELVSLVGPSGCGKTTVLKILAGLHEADGGTVAIGNATTPFDHGRDIGHGVPAGAAVEMAHHSSTMWLLPPKSSAYR